MANRKKKRKQTARSLFPTFFSSIPHHKRVIQSTLLYTLLILVFSLLLFNVFLSQTISPLYFKMVNEDKNAVIDYLISIRQSPLFFSEFLKFKNEYGTGIENGVFGKEIEEKSLIQKYEQILGKNPHAKDLLYGLYLIYNEKGNTKLAQKYFQKAKVVDPSLISKSDKYTNTTNE